MWEVIGPIMLALAALISATGGIYAIIVSKSTHAAQTKKTANEAVAVGDTTWIQRLEALNRNFEALQTLSDDRFRKLVAIEELLADHVSWDWAAVRKFREHGIPIEDPPSLIVVQQLARENKISEVDSNTMRGQGL